MNNAKNRFERCTGAAVLLILFLLPAGLNGQYKAVTPPPPVTAMTTEPHHHFFGYFGIMPWSKSERYLACLEVPFQNRSPLAGDAAQIRLIDIETKDIIPIGETSAWNFQQGTLMHWLPTSPDTLLIYNERRSRRYCSFIVNIYSGEKRELPLPISALSHNGKYAASLNFRRIHEMRPGYGYAGGEWSDAIITEAPKEDGLFIMNIEDGTSRLIVSFDKVNKYIKRPSESRDKPMWFNHTVFNPGDTRIFFLARVPNKKNGWFTAAFTVNIDGTDLRCILPYSWGASHFDWMTDDRIFVTTFYEGGKEIRYVIMNDSETDKGIKLIAPDILKQDGHGHFSPDRKWMASDTYPDKQNNRALLLINLQTDEVYKLGEFFSDPSLQGPVRCDLHPRWNHDGTKICFDSVHEGSRQVYVMDVSQIVRGQ